MEVAVPDHATPPPREKLAPPNIRPSIQPWDTLMLSIPKLEISREPDTSTHHDPTRTHPFRYRSRHHQELPHVVKFSGGRSSGMLLFTLLENGLLNRERGDVVIFNNTSCEHPETYRFAARCKTLVEEQHIPFFFVQFQTYEDAHRGEWKRIPSYRLVNDRPRSEDNPDGFSWRGETFEETISLKSYIPNQFARICTQSLKLEVTRQFLENWFASKQGIPHQGHGLPVSQIDPEALYRQHLKNGGAVPKDILLSKRAFVLNQPPNRPGQAYRDFSSAAAAFDNPAHHGRIFGHRASLGHNGAEYVALIGLRGDEQLRVSRVESRSYSPHANAGSRVPGGGVKESV